MIFLTMMTEDNYWENRYKNEATDWDLGEISPPLKAYFDQIPDFKKNMKILIPGAGYGHEAVYLWQNGFTSVTVLDLSKTALAKVKQDHPGFPESWLALQNIFDHEGSYDLIVEQTFFCALNPELRLAYAKKMKSLLKTGGKLVGLFFNRNFDHAGPPFGADLNAYIQLFSPLFNIHILESCHNSIKARQDSELFFIFEK